ncbi:MAG: zeta toxin family protein [Planctomycetaceae bacterium]|nr:zeta toxin family protein [Planctomycetaceae bacterium]
MTRKSANPPKAVIIAGPNGAGKSTTAPAIQTSSATVSSAVLWKSLREAYE